MASIRPRAVRPITPSFSIQTEFSTYEGGKRWTAKQISKIHSAAGRGNVPLLNKHIETLIGVFMWAEANSPFVATWMAEDVKGMKNSMNLPNISKGQREAVSGALVAADRSASRWYRKGDGLPYPVRVDAASAHLSKLGWVLTRMNRDNYNKARKKRLP